MEVLLKAKQAHNPQFEFLSYDRPLYPYYQHVLSAIRSCRYNPTLANDSAEGKYFIILKKHITQRIIFFLLKNV